MVLNFKSLNFGVMILLELYWFLSFSDEVWLPAKLQFANENSKMKMMILLGPWMEIRKSFSKLKIDPVNFFLHSANLFNNVAQKFWQGKTIPFT